MGQKTNPIGNRLGIIRGWDSNWYGGNNYGEKLAEDDHELVISELLVKMAQNDDKFLDINTGGLIAN